MPQTTTLNDFILALHFGSALPLTVFDLVDWARSLGPSFPETEQGALYGPVDFAPLGQTVPSVNFVAVDETTRVIARSIDSGFSLQLQPDRLVIAWSRSTPLGELAEYPGYDEMKANAQTHANAFTQWCVTKLGAAPKARLLEVGYHNHVPLDRPDGPRRISEVLATLNPGRPVNMFQVSWAEVIRSSPSALDVDPLSPRVLASASVGSIFPGRPVLSFNFIGLTPFEGSTIDDRALAALDSLHERILDMYAASVAPSLRPQA